MRRVTEESLFSAARRCRVPDKIPKHGNTKQFYSRDLLKRFLREVQDKHFRAVVESSYHRVQLKDLIRLCGYHFASRCIKNIISYLRATKPILIICEHLKNMFN